MLVSVCVITYNSSRYVIETLESVYAQSWPEIELIVSDDCSTDNTIEICRQWLSTHSSRFEATKIIVSSRNRGISANCNQAMDACHGKWIKSIAGDDLLLPDCISDYMHFAEINPEANFCFGRMRVFGSDDAKRQSVERMFEREFFDLSASEQYLFLIKNYCPVPAPSYICKRQAVIEYGIRNDERVPYMEDYPKWINITQKGQRLWLLDKDVVKYRISDTSTSTLVSPPRYFLESKYLFFKYYIKPYIKSDSPLKAWRREQTLLNDIKRNPFRSLALHTYDILADVYRTLITHK